MGTTVNPLNGEFDIDDGVYLQHLTKDNDNNWPKPETVHSWLVKATDGHTKEKPIDKRTCVRVRYAGQYHVDLPSYGNLNDEYMLAEKGNKGWHRSDPLALTVWFKEKVQLNGEQLRRLVRYFKAWADFQSGRRGKMPSGLILTTLSAQYFRVDERDDISLANTVQAICDAIHPLFCVYNPVDIKEELTARLTDEQKKCFQDAISDLSSDAASAIGIDDREKASNLWRRQLGDRFPLIETSIEVRQKEEDMAKLTSLYIAKNPARPWAYL
jgi:hypothetical protein